MNNKLQKMALANKNAGNEIYFKTTKTNQQILIVNYCKNQTMLCFMVDQNKLKKVASLKYLITKADATIHLPKLDVCKEYQFINIGTNMVLCLQDYAKKLGLKKIILNSLSPSLEFYQKLGFNQTAIVEDFIYYCDKQL